MYNELFCRSVFDYGIENEKLYNLSDILSNFSNYFNISLDGLKDMLFNYENKIIDYDVIKNYIYDYSNKIFELRFNKEKFVDEVIRNRYVDYNYFKKNLSILSNKGLRYIGLLEYMANMKSDVDRNEELEKVIDELGVFHYGSILKGIDINRFFSKIGILIDMFNDFLDKINSLDTYNNRSVDNFSLANEKALYPCISLVTSGSDRTSFNLHETGFYNRKRRELKYN